MIYEGLLRIRVFGICLCDFLITVVPLLCVSTVKVDVNIVECYVTSTLLHMEVPAHWTAGNSASGITVGSDNTGNKPVNMWDVQRQRPPIFTPPKTLSMWVSRSYSCAPSELFIAPTFKIFANNPLKPLPEYKLCHSCAFAQREISQPQQIDDLSNNRPLCQRTFVAGPATRNSLVNNVVFCNVFLHVC